MTREELRREGYDFYGFATAGKRAEYKALLRECEFVDVDEQILRFTVYFLGVRALKGQARLRDIHKGE